MRMKEKNMITVVACVVEDESVVKAEYTIDVESESMSKSPNGSEISSVRSFHQSKERSKNYDE